MEYRFFYDRIGYSTYFSYNPDFCILDNMEASSAINNGVNETQELVRLPKEYICDICGQEMSKRSNLFRHRKVKHSIELTDKTLKATLACGLCNSLFSKQLELCTHVAQVHHLETSIHSFEFENEDQFVDWRKNQEKKGRFEFTRKTGDHMLSDGSRRQYFYCHRSGTYNSSRSTSMGIRTPRRRGSNRTGFQCTAFAFSKICNGRVSVTYCLDHYKHDQWLGRLRLDEEVTATVARYLNEKRDKDWILEEIRGNVDNESEMSRQHLITRKDLNNIAKRAVRFNEEDDELGSQSPDHMDEEDDDSNDSTSTSSSLQEPEQLMHQSDHGGSAQLNRHAIDAINTNASLPEPVYLMLQLDHSGSNNFHRIITESLTKVIQLLPSITDENIIKMKLIEKAKELEEEVSSACRLSVVPPAGFNGRISSVPEKQQRIMPARQAKRARLSGGTDTG